ncbi:MAG: LytTR family transcriptional regulator DNA-binding domain-containing protein [Actinobacteria bacterium]|nr:LytTR family transcriptional regulator DNA-binding domain-containing protein [Actinomycetota bacterium]
MAFEATAATGDAWERFVAGEPTLPGVRPEVLRSWHRCRDRYGVDPTLTHAPTATEPGWQGPEQGVLAAELGAAAAAIAARAVGSSAAISAADGEGRVLAGWGHQDTLERARAQNFGPAFAWSEPMAGTSAIGTALATGGITEVHRFEHWCSGFHPWSCAAVAISDPTTAEPVGSLSVTVFKQPLPDAARGWLEDSAAELESRLRRRAASASSELVTTHRVRPRGRFGSAAIDVGGRIVAADEAARLALAGSQDNLRRLARAIVDRARSEHGWTGAAELDSGGVVELEAIYSAQRELIGVLASVAEPGEPSPRAEGLHGGRIAGELGDRILLVETHEVRLVEILDRVIWVDSDQGRLRLRGRSLEEIERALGSRGLLRVNRRTLVNLARVRELLPGFKGGLWVLLADSSEPIEVSRRRVPVLREALGLDPA